MKRMPFPYFLLRSSEVPQWNIFSHTKQNWIGRVVRRRPISWCISPVGRALTSSMPPTKFPLACIFEIQINLVRIVRLTDEETGLHPQSHKIDSPHHKQHHPLPLLHFEASEQRDVSLFCPSSHLLPLLFSVMCRSDCCWIRMAIEDGSGSGQLMLLLFRHWIPSMTGASEALYLIPSLLEQFFGLANPEIWNKTMLCALLSHSVAKINWFIHINAF